jgi:lysozyme
MIGPLIFNNRRITTIDILDDAANFIKPFEGFRSHAYQCPAGVWTIGYGTTKGVKPGMIISRAEAADLLLSDIGHFDRGIKRLGCDNLNPHQHIAVLDFVYNLGLGAFERSTFRMKLLRKEYDQAAKEILRWNKAVVNGVIMPLKGLTIRRGAEYQLFMQ